MFRHDLLCFGRVRWASAGTRAHHLLSRAARDRFVFYWEEPVLDAGEPRVELVAADGGVMVATPHLPAGLPAELALAAQRALVDDLIATQRLGRPVLWYDAPMALGWTRHLRARSIVYDCAGEPPAGDPVAADRHAQLLRKADVVFTASQALSEHLRDRGNVHCAPSSVDLERFAQARGGAAPLDLARLGRPRVGFAGPIDDRVDLALVAELADRRPDVAVVMLGAVIGDPARLPARPNLHWLGARDDGARPAYLAALDAVILPYRRDHTTRFHAPPEALEAVAAGVPVIATPLRDLVQPLAEAGVVRIAGCAATMATAIDVVRGEDAVERVARADAFLADRSWDAAWAAAWARVDAAIKVRTSGVHATTGGAGAYARPVRRHRAG